MLLLGKMPYVTVLPPEVRPATDGRTSNGASRPMVVRRGRREVTAYASGEDRQLSGGAGLRLDPFDQAPADASAIFQLQGSRSVTFAGRISGRLASTSASHA